MVELPQGLRYPLRMNYSMRIRNASIALLGGLGAAFLLLACGPSQVNQVVINQENLFPEGVVWDAPRSRFLVSSLRKGKIGSVNDQGVYTVFAEDDKLISVIGLHIDADRNRLIALNSDPGASEKTDPATQRNLAGVAVYNLATGEELFYADLSKLNADDAAHFANDATVDRNGNIYVTNSFSPVIYKIDSDYNTSVFLRSEKFVGEGFNLNGIEYFKAGYLLAAHSGQGALYKIPLDDPESFAKVQLDASHPGIDGLVKTGEGALLAVVNGSGGSPAGAHFLSSDDDWASAQHEREVVRDEWLFPTTADVRSGKVYVLNAKLSKLFGGELPVAQFEIFNVGNAQGQ